jgi:hypothetical protein
MVGTREVRIGEGTRPHKWIECRNESKQKVASDLKFKQCNLENKVIH